MSGMTGAERSGYFINLTGFIYVIRLTRAQKYVIKEAMSTKIVFILLKP